MKRYRPNWYGGRLLLVLRPDGIVTPVPPSLFYYQDAGCSGNAYLRTSGLPAITCSALAYGIFQQQFYVPDTTPNTCCVLGEGIRIAGTPCSNVVFTFLPLAHRQAYQKMLMQTGYFI